MSTQRRQTGRRIVLSIVLWVVAILHIYPIILIVLSSIKTKPDLATHPFGIPSRITFEYFGEAFRRMHYLRSLANTLIIASISVILLILISAMAAYAIARRKTAFYNVIYVFFLAGIIIPFQMVMIPLYKLMLGAHLLNTYHGMVLFYGAYLAPFTIFLVTGFIKTIPKELEEAAYLDGYGKYRVFFLIVFPLLQPVISTAAVLNAFSVWNDFLAPLLFLQSSRIMTLTVQLSSFRGMYFNDWSLIFTGVSLIVVPMLVLYLFAQRFIIGGITAGSVKG